MLGANNIATRYLSFCNKSPPLILKNTKESENYSILMFSVFIYQRIDFITHELFY